MSSEATDELRAWWEGEGPYRNNEDNILDELLRQRGSIMPNQTDRNANAANDLRSACERYWTPDQGLVSKIKRNSGLALDYVDHATVTRMLIDVDPLWTWHPMGTDMNGAPIVDCDDAGNPRALWIYLEVHGKRIPAVGTIERPGAKNYGDTLKELIGDALRNGALRFGICGSLWARSNWDDATAEPEPETPQQHVARMCMSLAPDDRAALKKAFGITQGATVAKIVETIMAAGYDPDHMTLEAWIQEQS